MKFIFKSKDGETSIVSFEETAYGFFPEIDSEKIPLLMNSNEIKMALNMMKSIPDSVPLKLFFMAAKGAMLIAMKYGV